MQVNTIRSAINKKTGRQQVFACLILLPFVLFTLSGFTFIPNTAQTPKQATETTQPLTSQMGSMLTRSTADDSCTETTYVVQFSLSEVTIYFNMCALQHLSALASSAGAGGAILAFIMIGCEECAPVAAGITAVAAIVTASIDNLQYAIQPCGGAFLIISWDGGVQFESACSTQANGS